MGAAPGLRAAGPPDRTGLPCHLSTDAQPGRTTPQVPAFVNLMQLTTCSIFIFCLGKFGVKVEGAASTVDSMFDEFVPMTQPYLREQPDGTIRHTSDLIADEAIAFIEAVPREAAFCLTVGFNAGHAVDGDLENHFPYPAAEADLLAGTPMERPRLDDAEIFEAMPGFLRDSMNRDRWYWRWDTPAKYDHNLRNYLRLIAGMDRNIGRILESLKARGRDRNTIVIFLGDNGYYMGERGFAGKWSHFDESLRIPMIVFDARHHADERGTVSDTLVLNLDVAPTILQAAGISPRESDHRGQPLPIESSEALALRSGFRCEHHMDHPRIPRWIGYRSEDWKYARYVDHPEGGEFLHDLRVDPDELVNLANDPSHAETLEHLRRCSKETSDARTGATP